MNLGISYHSPLLVTIGKENMVGGRPFRFFKHLVLHPNLESIVQTSWQNVKSMRDIWNVLKVIKQEQKSCIKSNSRGFRRRLRSLGLRLIVFRML